VEREEGRGWEVSGWEVNGWEVSGWEVSGVGNPANSTSPPLLKPFPPEK